MINWEKYLKPILSINSFDKVHLQIFRHFPSFNKYWPSTYSLPGTVVGAWKTQMNKQTQFPAMTELTSSDNLFLKMQILIKHEKIFTSISNYRNMNKMF